MAYIIQHSSKTENKYLIHPGVENISVWGSKPRAAYRYDSREEAQNVIDDQLKYYACDIIEIE